MLGCLGTSRSVLVSLLGVTNTYEPIMIYLVFVLAEQFIVIVRRFGSMTCVPIFRWLLHLQYGVSGARHHSPI